MLRKVLVKNYRVFENFQLDFSPGMNIIVGDNDAGKSTLLEAINLALTGRLGGNPIMYELSPYLFNQAVTQRYISGLASAQKPSPPEILIEVYLTDIAEHAKLKGDNNSLGEDCPGVKLRIVMNDDFNEEYESYIRQPENVKLVPTEYYKVEWLSFAGGAITGRSIRVTASLIDASEIRLQSGTDHYMQSIISSHLDAAERVELSRSYRSLRETFTGLSAVTEVNRKLAGNQGDISSRNFSLSIDISQRSAWERSLVPHLDDLPFRYMGNGEQSSLKILLALNRRVDDCHVVLIEEPENHLSFSSLNDLIAKIAKKCAGKQVLVTTHDSYVLNKLGLEHLILLSPEKGVRITELPSDTVDYFKKLSGYDTLRLVLAKRVILVEGPSDELIVQRAYRDIHGHLPIADGIDVINVRGLSAKRFLDIAVQLKKRVAVVNDNDGDASAMESRYADYTTNSFITVHVGQGDHLKTLEPQLLAASDRETLNGVFGTSHATDEALLKYMQDSNNKTTCALAIFESEMPITMPEYIRNAIDL